MSAYICNPEHFGILGATAAQNHCVIREWSQKTHADDTLHEAQRVARCLALENIRSVAYRYPLSESGDRPGPNLRDQEIVEAAAIYAGYFIEHPQRLTSARLMSLIACLDYQCCETDDWPQTLAYQQLQHIKSTVIPGPVGYDDGQWGFTRPIAEIEALFERRAA
ncbi:MAG: hypothetical protein RLZZ09_3670 [Pseudomonadota bacterium]|jgi:hypothetical protein